MVSAQRGFSPGNPVFSAPLKSCPKSYSISCWRDLGGPHTGRDVSPGGGGGVTPVLRDDRMGQKSKPKNIHRASDKTPQKSRTKS